MMASIPRAVALMLPRSCFRTVLHKNISCKYLAPVNFTPKRHVFGGKDKESVEDQKELMIRQKEMFDSKKKAKDKRTFQDAIVKYDFVQGTHKRGHVEFIYAALSRMKEYGVERDLETYKKLLDVFPKGKLIPRNAWQVEFMHYPKQQQCCIDVLDQMESNGVIPDDDTGYQLLVIFGDKSHAFRKYRRMMYWMPKFKNLDPFKIPKHLPEDPIKLAIIALKKMAVDLENCITVFQNEELDLNDETFIASAQSPRQIKLIEGHPTKTPLFVEGGYNIWVREKCLTHFILRADATPENIEKKEEKKELFDWNLFYGSPEDKPSEIIVPPSVHEQEDGTILGMCITSSSSKKSLMSWIRCLEEANPRLADIPVVFKLITPEEGLQTVDEEAQVKDVVF